MDTAEHRRILETYGKIRVDTHSPKLSKAYVRFNNGPPLGCSGPNEENAVEGLYERINELMYFEMLDILKSYPY